MGPRVLLALEDSLEDLAATDAVVEELQPHHVGPARLPAEGERCDALRVELRHQVLDVAPGLRRLGADLVEDRPVVVQDDGGHRLDRHRVDLVLHRGRAEGRGEDLVLELGVLGEEGREVLDLAGVDVALQTTAAPAPDERRTLAGADRRLDLLLVGVVLERRVLDLPVGVGVVEALDLVLADALLRLPGQEPVGGAATTTAVAPVAASRAGAGGGRTAAGGETGRGGAAGGDQAEEVPAGRRSRCHGHLRVQGAVDGRPTARGFDRRHDRRRRPTVRGALVRKHDGVIPVTCFER